MEASGQDRRATQVSGRLAAADAAAGTGRGQSTRTSWRPRRAAVKESRASYHKRSAAVTRDEGDRPLGRKGAREEIGSRESVHVPSDRQAKKIQQRRRHIDDRSALLAAGLDGGAIGQEKTVRG